MTLFKMMPYCKISILAIWLLSGYSSYALSEAIPSKTSESDQCVALGDWIVPGSGSGIGKASQQNIITRAAKAAVVLLGETHINADHHRWQLQALATLHTQRPDMVIGFEMFPRRIQPVLDRWVAGELTEKEFLRVAEWDRVWNADANLYLPLFHFARMNRIPMLALNIEHSLRHKVAAKGFYGVPVEEREGLTRPAEPSDAYVDYLLPIYKQHDRKNNKQSEVARDDPDFRRFIGGQQLWDRAMAQVLQQPLVKSGKHKPPLVVGIMGSGHIVHGYGVAHQLRDLGVKNIAALLPWDIDRSCKQLAKGFADAVFGVLPYASDSIQPQFQRLGIRYEIGRGGAVVLQVERNSIAEAANLQDSDVILQMAGMPITKIEDVINIVKRQAPGTWLPMTINRNHEEMQIIAKFPPVKR